MTFKVRSVVRAGGIFMIAMAVGACNMQRAMPEAHHVDTLFMFAGTGGAMAYSIDETGANLPRQYAPWRFQRAVSTSGPTFKAGVDKAALAEVKKEGFAVSVWTVTIERGGAS